MDSNSNIFGRNGEGYIRDEDFPSPFDNIKSYLLQPDTFLGGNDETLPLNSNTIHVDDMLQSEVTANDNDGTLLPSKSNPTSNSKLLLTQRNLNSISSLHDFDRRSPLCVTPNLHDPNTVSKSSTKNRILLPDGLEIGPYGLTIINSMSFSEPHDEIKTPSLEPSNSNILSQNKETHVPFSTPTIDVQNISSSMKKTQRGASRNHIPLKLLLAPQSSCSISNHGMPTLWKQQLTLQASSSISLVNSQQSSMHARRRPFTSQPFNLVDQQQVLVKSKRIMTPEMLRELERKDSKRYKI